MKRVTPFEAGERLDLYLSRMWPELTRRQARLMIGEGSVFLNGRCIRIQSRPVAAGDRITLLPPSERSAETPPPSEGSTPRTSGRPPSSEGSSPRTSGLGAPQTLEPPDWSLFGGEPAFLYRDRHLGILNKPSGLLVEPSPKEDMRTCLRQLETLLRFEGVHPRRLYVTAAHRLDAQASGCLAFAFSKSAAGGLGSQFEDHSAFRVYHALVLGRLDEEEGSIRLPIGHIGPGYRRGVVAPNHPKAQAATTHFRVLQRFASATLIQVRLETGRTHQIRVHFSHLGHPLLGDRIYGAADDPEGFPSVPRLFLHAAELSLKHPITGEVLRVQAPFSSVWEAYLSQLSKPHPETRCHFEPVGEGSRSGFGGGFLVSPPEGCGRGEGRSEPSNEGG